MFDTDLNDAYLKLVCIDPGTDTLGISTLHYYPKLKKIIVISAETFSGAKLSKRDYNIRDLIFDNTPSKIQRLSALSNVIYDYLIDVSPDIIVAESAFLKYGRATAFEALVETLCMIREVIKRYDISTPLYVISPKAAKKAIGTVIKKKMDKDDARFALHKYIDENELVECDIDLNILDEHSTDSLVVGLGFLEGIT